MAKNTPNEYTELDRMEAQLDCARKSGTDDALMLDNGFVNKLYRLRMEKLERETKMNMAKNTLTNGLTRASCSCGCIPLIIGATAASCVSWVCNHSLPWMIFHGMLNWLYLLYKIPEYVMTNY